jgi:hypothetical protein
MPQSFSKSFMENRNVPEGSITAAMTPGPPPPEVPEVKLPFNGLIGKATKLKI